MNGRKIISVILMLALVLTMAVPATVCAASSFTDVNGHWAQSYINKAVSKGFVKGYTDGTFKPDNPVTRAEFSTMINKAIGNTATTGISFTDVPNSEWFYNDVAKAVAATYTSGYDDKTFKPNQSITRQEAACMLARIVPVYGYSTSIKNYSDASSVADWAADSLQRMCGKQYIGAYSDGRLHPTDSLTRAQTAKIICDVLEKETIVTAATSVKSETTLKGKIYANGVTLTKDLDDDDANIENCVILGSLYVQGGGENTVTIQNSRVAYASVSKSDDAVRVLVKGESFINWLSASKTAAIETSGLGGGTFGPGIKNLDIESSAKATLKGSFPRVNVKGSASSMTLASGSIEELNVPSGGRKSDITVESNASVTNANVDCESYFHGEGTIKKMKANADSITYEKAPKDITIGSGVKTKPTEGKKKSDIDFSPEDDATGISKSVKPTITFNEAIETYKGKDIDSDYLEDNITFKTKSSSGKDVSFTAKISSNDKTITITPKSDLSDDQVYYLAFASKIFRTKSDEENITAHSVNWTVGGKDSDGVSFSPSNGDTGVKVTVDPTITFDSAIETYKGKAIDDDYLEDNIVFREKNSSGTKVKFTAEINSKKKIITIKPKSDLDKNQKYYLGFESKIFRTESKEKNVPAKNITFTVGTAVTTPSLSSVSATSTDSTVTLSATPNMSGTMYAVITESSSKPSASQIVAGTDASGKTAAKKTETATANSKKTFSAFTGLKPNTTYYCYVVLKNGSTYSSVASTSAKTTQNMAKLTGISTSVGTLSPSFRADETSYDVLVPFGSSASEVTISATAGSGATILFDGATVSGNSKSLPLNGGTGVSTNIRVQEDQKTSTTYKVTARVKGNTITDVKVINSVMRGTKFKLDAGTSKATVEIEAEDSKASITGDLGTGTGSLSKEVSVSTGDNSFSYTVNSNGETKTETVIIFVEEAEPTPIDEGNTTSGAISIPKLLF